MTSFFRHTRLAVAAGALMATATLAAPHAQAAGTTFDWNPEFGPFAGSASAIGTSSIVANDIGGLDFAHVALTNAATGAFTEDGIIKETAFDLSGSTASFGNLQLPSGYALYIVFSGAGTATPGPYTPGPTTVTKTGSFSSLTFSFYEALASAAGPTYGVTTGGPTLSGVSGAKLLATGSLIDAADSVVNLSITPSGNITATASLETSFIIDPSATGFFVSPSFLNVQFVAATNTPSVVSAPDSSDILINGGGVNLTYAAVPEPASLALLAGGLLGLGATFRRRNRA